MTSICLTYFKSLTLQNLQAALFSLTKQDFHGVDEIVIIDNNTDDEYGAIKAVAEQFIFHVPIRLTSFKHGDQNKTHSWSSNAAVLEAAGERIIFTRADYVLDQNLVSSFQTALEGSPNAFVTGSAVHLALDVDQCYRQTRYLTEGAHVLRTTPGAVEENYMKIDAGVWALSRENFFRVGGLDERITSWGHAQTHFQWKLHEAGVEAIRLPNVRFYHPRHAAERDLALAHQQAAELGLDLKGMWARYEGVSPY